MKLTKKDSKTISELVERAGFYRPTIEQRVVKSEFHKALINGPTPDRVTAAFATQITNRVIIEKWWALEGFRAWFLDANSFDNNAEAAANMALEIVSSVLLRAERDGDRLKAAQILFEIAGKNKKIAPEIQFMDKSLPDDIQELDRLISEATGGTNGQP